MEDTIRVVVIEDHNLVRAGIRAVLQNCEGIEILAEGNDGYVALELADVHLPDVVLMDIAMSSMNGLDAASRILKAHPDIKVVILSMHADEEYVWQALHIGVSGYLLKDAGTAELELALRAVKRGETYLSPRISKQLVSEYISRPISGSEANSLARLSRRQKEVLQLISEGRTTQQIAEILCISTKTVETHRAQLMDKLDIHDIPSLVRYALRVGLISAI